MSKEQNITNEIKPINQNLDKLKHAFPHCFDKNGEFDFAKFKTELVSSDINIAREGYSLDWLGKSYARVLASDAATTLLKEDITHNAKPENTNSQNLLIKGDNLEVLKHLSNAYYEKVKMIYIDPPYNTGSDGFVYNDDRKFTTQQLQDLAGVSVEEAKRILEFTQSNSNSHSAWLTFMYPRLYIAKQLLKDDGVIFVSIDDNEVAQLRLLMDEVFGEENFVEIFSWTKTSTPPALSNKSRKVNEYILCYEKDKNSYRYFGEELDGGDQPLLNEGNNEGELVIPKDKIIFKIADGKYPSGIYHRIELLSNIEINNGKTNNDLKIRGRFKWQQSFLNQEIDKGTTFIVKSNKFSVRFQRVEDNSYKTPTNHFRDKIVNPNLNKENCNIDTNETSSSQLIDLFKQKVFDFPKPTSLIKYLINFLPKNSDDIIVDFFAGSGSTAHSVMELNIEDGGNRKFILVQLPELIDVKKSKVAYDFVKNELGITPPTIFEITKERIIRAAKQIAENNSTKIADIQKEIAKLQQELPTEETQALIEELQNEIRHCNQQDLGFKIFETTPIWDDYDFKAAKLANAEKLFDDDKLTEEDIKALFTTWKTYDGSTLTEPVQTVDLAGYEGYYTKQKLYLMHKGFGTETLKALLEKIDTDANFNPTAIIAFGYYFESKALREIAENIKTYNNKKNIDIDFITRY
ncbi:site-specific DNA-methyltransferase [Myroides odoratimimus]|uniref:site-specific DNA-methyltransferase n=1 Tax=Myroides odoratimimus TaxID=76832 RepID=UPI0025774E76|nr:site-specific DNA-methyltransferase [Myroides odoratimimus]MDM1484323.1 site-specific DNA-methyltransferase [Myroides odoratimimus]